MNEDEDSTEGVSRSRPAMRRDRQLQRRLRLLRSQPPFAFPEALDAPFPFCRGASPPRRLPSPPLAQDMTAPPYPETRRGDMVETLFGEAIADPYRWLENDVRNDPEVADWVERQNAVTDAYLAQAAGARVVQAADRRAVRLRAVLGPGEARQPLFLHAQFGPAEPVAAVRARGAGRRAAAADRSQRLGGRRGDRARATGAPRPTARSCSTRCRTAAPTGGSSACSTSATGAQLADEIRWAKFTDLAWVGEEGFLYSRFPEPEQGQDFQALNYDQAVYYHRLGTPQSADQLVYATPEHRERNHTASVTSDGRWAVITSSVGTDARYEVRAIDLAARGEMRLGTRELVTGFDNAWSLIDSDRRHAVVRDQQGRAALQGGGDRPRRARRRLARGGARDGAADRRRRDRRRAADPVVSQGRELDRAHVRPRRQGAGAGRAGRDRQRHRLQRQAGRSRDVLQLLELQPARRRSTASTLATGRDLGVRRAELKFDPARFAVEQRFYASKDGTRVPVFIVRRKDVTGPAPTLLYGYGGFDVSMTPALLGQPAGVGRGRRGVRAGQHPRRRRVRQGVARRRAAATTSRTCSTTSSPRASSSRPRAWRASWRCRAARTAGCWSARWSTSGPSCSPRATRKWA